MIQKFKKHFHHIKNEIRDSAYNKELRKRLTNHDFSIISTNCMGGILYHRYKERFLSPTINLWFDHKDFVVFCENAKEYMENGKLHFIDSEKKYPVGLLKVPGLPDVKIYFLHYLAEEDASSKWYERAKRFNYDNFYIIGSDEGLDIDDLKRLSNVKCNNTVIFTAGKKGMTDKCYLLKKYNNCEDVGKFVNDIDAKTGIRYVEKEFDFVEFFNKK